MTDRYKLFERIKVSTQLILLMILAVVLPVILSSCVDEINAPDLDIPEGETTMMTEIRFSPLVTANLNGTESRSNGMEFGPVTPLPPMAPLWMK